MTTVRALGRDRATILVVVLVAACGGLAPTAAPTPSTATSTVGSVCELVPDMDALVGLTAVAEPSSYTVGSSERCLWVYVTDPSRYVGLTLGERSSHADTIGSFGEGEVVEGLGDEARWWAANRTLSTAIGERSLQVDLQLDDLSAPMELATSIARSALERLD